MEPLFKGSHLAVLRASAPVRTKDGTGIDLKVYFENLGEVPFTAHPKDTMDHGRWLYEQANAGAFGPVADYERPDVTVDDLQADLDKLMPDVILGLATDDELSLAKNLRRTIKEMTA
ncbi:hypothetical protein [Pseudomonas sp. B14(2017)]|uniref:hypothetical protein n=1 Tax=Pseudomonas sp. B14(2017) TaxID=1981745 RepID=UPI000A1F13FD|nr:hypothetical protein [Pseudomonas sp. B14(2017)]